MNLHDKDDPPRCIGKIENVSLYYEKVLSLRKYFKHMFQYFDEKFLSDNSSDKVFLDKIKTLKSQKVWCLGHPLHIYVHEDDYKNVYYSENAMIKEVLLKEFCSLYEEICKILENEYKIKFYLTDEIAIPGFHIFECDNGDVKFPDDFHIDLMVESVINNIDLNKILSITIPLQLPNEAEGSLSYIIKGEENVIKYQVGNVYVWNSNMYHRVNSFSCSSLSCRCTFQAFIYFKNNAGYLYW